MSRNEPSQQVLHQQSDVPPMQHVLARDLKVTGTGAAGNDKAAVRGGIVPPGPGFMPFPIGTMDDNSAPGQAISQMGRSLQALVRRLETSVDEGRANAEVSYMVTTGDGATFLAPHPSTPMAGMFHGMRARNAAPDSPRPRPHPRPQSTRSWPTRR